MIDVQLELCLSANFNLTDSSSCNLEKIIQMPCLPPVGSTIKIAFADKDNIADADWRDVEYLYYNEASQTWEISLEDYCVLARPEEDAFKMLCETVKLFLENGWTLVTGEARLEIYLAAVIT